MKKKITFKQFICFIIYFLYHFFIYFPILRQSLRLPDENLKRLQLNPGKNKIRYIVKTNLQGEQFVEARIFLWSQPLKLVFSDIDGTVTKSDVMGHVMSILKKDWTHESIAALFSKFIENGCKMIYITARPFSQVRNMI